MKWNIHFPRILIYFGFLAPQVSWLPAWFSAVCSGKYLKIRGYHFPLRPSHFILYILHPHYTSYKSVRLREGR